MPLHSNGRSVLSAKGLAAMIQEARGAIDYDERGFGPTVVFVPGSCSTGAAWRPVISAMGEGLRSVTTSLLGYGGTAERRTGHNGDISVEAEILESVIRRAACPVHLVGHSFGGLVSLAVALRSRVPLSSLTIVEAPATELLRHAGELNHHRAFREMTDAYFAEYQAGEPAAIATMVDFYGGPGTFASWPERVRDYAVETTPINIHDWANVYGFDPTPAMLAKITIPTLILLGDASHPAVQCANRLLYRHLSGASLVAVRGAPHFMINTHAEKVARVVRTHVCLSEPMNRDGYGLRSNARANGHALVS